MALTRMLASREITGTGHPLGEVRAGEGPLPSRVLMGQAGSTWNRETAEWKGVPFKAMTCSQGTQPIYIDPRGGPLLLSPCDFLLGLPKVQN